MGFIDTHTHLYLEQFDKDRDTIIQNAIEKGVEAFLLPNIDLSSIAQVKNLVLDYPERCFPMMGLHPCSVALNWMDELDKIEKELFQDNYCAVGEIGIDLFWEKKYLNEQINAFETQIKWAKELALPIVIHCREAFDEIFEVLDRLNDAQLKGVFHCFTGTFEQAERVIAYENFLLGIGGVLTFKKAQLDQVVSKIDPQYLVLETDAPYLAPVPFRGKRNESSYLIYTAARLSEILGIPMKELERITNSNAQQLFKLDL